MLQPGTIVLDKYRIERVLGKGGMGIVVAARHVHLGELFAIKMILPEAVEQPEAVERFLREARACAKLKSEHVARVHDIGTLPDKSPYMLMEHLTGEDLSDVLVKRGALPVEEAALYVYQACEAIAEAHGNGIVHRDLKPSNLFLTHRHSGTPCIKVLDFGISKELDPNNRTGKNLTKTGSFLGSPMYMPPEQMVDIKTTDVRGDVWALGVILYELVTGEPPFFAEAVTSVITKVLLHHPEPPSHVCPGIPATFDAIVMRCLEKKPEDRYGSVQELMMALEAFVPPAQPSFTGLEKSISISRSSLVVSSPAHDALRVQLAETADQSSTPASVAIAETMAGDVAADSSANAALKSARSAVQATVHAVPLFTESSNGEAALPVVREPVQGATAFETPVIATTETRLDVKANPERIKKRTLAVVAIASVATGIGILSFGSSKPEPSGVVASASGGEVMVEAPVISANPVPEVVQEKPLEAKPLASNKVSPEPVVSTTTSAVTKRAIPKSTATSTSTSKRGTTKKVFVPGYND